MSNNNNHLEEGVIEGVNTLIGKDPRGMTVSELNSLGHEKMPIMKVIRQNCLDCCGGNSAEVRVCAIVSCPMWPYRMKKNPFSERKANPKAIAALQAAREAKQDK